MQVMDTCIPPVRFDVSLQVAFHKHVIVAWEL